jgi:hypothetical protein
LGLLRLILGLVGHAGLVGLAHFLDIIEEWLFDYGLVLWLIIVWVWLSLEEKQKEGCRAGVALPATSMKRPTSFFSRQREYLLRTLGNIKDWEIFDS